MDLDLGIIQVCSQAGKFRFDPLKILLGLGHVEVRFSLQFANSGILVSKTAPMYLWRLEASGIENLNTNMIFQELGSYCNAS